MMRITYKGPFTDTKDINLVIPDLMHPLHNSLACPSADIFCSIALAIRPNARSNITKRKPTKPPILNGNDIFRTAV